MELQVLAVSVGLFNQNALLNVYLMRIDRERERERERTIANCGRRQLRLTWSAKCGATDAPSVGCTCRFYDMESRLAESPHCTVRYHRQEPRRARSEKVECAVDGESYRGGTRTRSAMTHFRFVDNRVPRAASSW